MMLNQFFPALPTTKKIHPKKVDYSAVLRAQALSQPNTEAMCGEIVKKDGMAIQQVKFQTPLLCRLAVEQNWQALRYCHHKTAEVIHIVIRDHPEAATLLPQTDEYHQMMLAINTEAFLYFKAPSERVCLQALAVNPDFIAHIVSPSTTLAMTAIRARVLRTNKIYDTDFFADIEHTHELAMAVLNEYPKLFRFFPADFLKGTLAELAVAKYPANIQYVPIENQTEAMCNMACRLNPNVIPWSSQLNRVVLREIIARHPTALEYCTEQDFALCVRAVRAKPATICYVSRNIYAVWHMAGKPVDMKDSTLRFLSNVNARHRRLPPSITDLEDPVTLEPIVANTLCAFLSGSTSNTWHLVGTLDSVIDIIRKKFRDSTYSAFFVPHRNAIVSVQEMKWFMT